MNQAPDCTDCFTKVISSHSLESPARRGVGGIILLLDKEN